MYAKVFSQMYDGSLCTQGPWEALVTFQQFLVLADQEGVVDMTAEAIARRTTIPLEIIERGIACLLLPDKKSRTPTEDGRRILPLSPGRDWGWVVVNYIHYRQLKREADRREYHRDYWHKRKTQQTQHTQPNQPIAEAEAEAEELNSVSGLRPSPSANAEGHEAAADQVKKPPSKASPPYQAIADMYNEILPELPSCRLLTDKRKRLIGKIWTFALTSKTKDGEPRAKNPEEAIEWIRGYFEHARLNDFLMGNGPRSEAHANWRPTIDFIIGEKGMTQVMEQTVRK